MLHGYSVAHLFYLQDILGFKNINSVFWTLCYEVQFYAVFALLLCARSWKVIAAAFVVSLLWPLGLAPNYPGLFVNLWFGFLLGVGAYSAWKHAPALPWFLIYAAVILTEATLRGDLFAIACALTALSIVGVARADRIGALNWRWLQFLGAISYSLYLSHNPIMGATFRVGYMLTERTPVTETVWWLASTATAITAAAALWWLVEKPSVALSKWYYMRAVSAYEPGT